MTVDDEYHATILAALVSGLRSGRRPEERFRIVWLCGGCTDVHQITGDLAQTQNTISAFLCWGYPQITILDEAFVLLAEADGKDLSKVSDLKEVAAEYQHFLDQTRA